MFYENQKQREVLNNKLSNKENFALVRFGEGETRVIMSQGTGGYLRCIAKNPIREWEYNPKQDKYLYDELKKSFLYKEENYLKAAIKDGKNEHINFVNKSIGDENLFSTSFFYSDEYYNDFSEKYISYFEKYDSINFLCSNGANLENLNINFKKVYNNFDISNAWKQTEYTDSVIKEIKETKNCVYIFAVGFNSKIMIKKLFELNKENVYYDLGANLDLNIYGRKTRGRHMP